MHSEAEKIAEEQLRLVEALPEWENLPAANRISIRKIYTSIVTHISTDGDYRDNSILANAKILEGVANEPVINEREPEDSDADSDAEIPLGNFADFDPEESTASR